MPHRLLNCPAAGDTNDVGNLARLLAILALGLVLAAAVSAGVILTGAGVFWLFLYGDDAWPSGAETALVAAGYGAGLLAGVSTFIVLSLTGPLRLHRTGAAAPRQRRSPST
jgi:hypothetical protein